MGNLVKCEFFKLKKSLTYKLVLISFLIFEIIFIHNEISIGVLHTGVLYTGAEWLYRMPAQCSYYIGFLFIYAADFAAGEFRNRTYAAGFLCGYPRKVILWAKAVAYFTGLIPFLLIHAATGTVMWTIQSAFGMEMSVELAVLIGKALLYCIIGFAVIGCLGFLCTFIARNRIGSLSLCWAVVYILGVMAANAEDIKYPVISKVLVFIFRLTVFLQLGELNGVKNMKHIPLSVTFFSSLAWIALMLLSAKNLFEKRDLK